MDLTKYYPDIVAKYPAYVTKRELCEICHICPKTAYNLEQQGEIPYTIEQNHLIRSHKIKLTDILAYLYRRECRQEADSPYICAMRTFYDEHLSPYSDLLSVKDIQQITGFSSSAIVRWISTGILKAFQPGKQYTVPKDFNMTYPLILAKIPVKNPWEIFAYLPFGGWNECPNTPELMAVAKYWFEQHGAVPAAMSHDELEFLLPAPVPEEKAMDAAVELYGFCPDVIDQGPEDATVGALADVLRQSTVWYFWWD